jgi:hypothetical protein
MNQGVKSKSMSGKLASAKGVIEDLSQISGMIRDKIASSVENKPAVPLHIEISLMMNHARLQELSSHIESNLLRRERLVLIRSTEMQRFHAHTGIWRGTQHAIWTLSGRCSAMRRQ